MSYLLIWLRFLDNISETALRPDILLISETSQQVVLLELTVPSEAWMKEASKRKKAKYAILGEECHRWE